MKAEINRLIKSIIIFILFGKNNGDYILDEEWDNLIILDACRYDVFSRLIKKFNIYGKLEYRYSRGSDTTEFLLKNFDKKKEYKDIVYVTANPFVSIILKKKIYKIIPVWDFGWDNKFKTVPPETMYYYALKTMLKYPDKRIIIHFIQPHYPYINYKFKSMEKAFSRLRHDGKATDLRRSDFSLPFRFRRVLRVILERKIYHDRFYIEIDQKIHFKAYVDNLKLVLPYVKKLVNVLPGKTVVTADHGEAFGEKIHPLIPIRVYGHLPEIRIPALVKVPWLIIEEQDKPPEEIRKHILREELAKYERNKMIKVINKLKKRIET